MGIPKDIEIFVREAFAPDEQSEALSLLANAKIHDATPAEPRLLRCALVASDQTLKGLTQCIDALAVDYRDVILAGEYIRNGTDWTYARDLSQPFAPPKENPLQND